MSAEAEKIWVDLPTVEKYWEDQVQRQIKGKGRMLLHKSRKLFVVRCGQKYKVDDHETDAKFGIRTTYSEKKNGPPVDTVISKLRVPKRKPGGGDSGTNGKQKRQLNLYATLKKDEPTLWPRILAIGFHGATEEQLTELRSDGQTRYVVDHMNTRHYSSLIDNLEVITRRESDARGGYPGGHSAATKSTKKKAATKKTAAGK